MVFSFIIIKKHKYFIYILLLFQIYLSKQSKKKNILLNVFQNNTEREFPEDIFKRFEELVNKQKKLINDIEDIKAKNYEYNLEIETNKVYIIISYVIMSIIIFIGIILKLIKLYFQCHKKSAPNSMIDLKDKV